MRLRVFLLIFLLCFVSACVHTSEVVVPPGCENSLIIQKIPNYRHVDFLLQLANLEALKHHVYTKLQALDAINEIESVVKEPNTTYSQVLAVVISKIEWVNEHAGAELFLVSQYLEVFHNDKKLDPCDRDLLLSHLQKQKTVIALIR